jgi:hypothetical protein
MIVELKPTEYALAAHLAAIRQTVNSGSGVRDKQMGTDDGYKIGVDGLVAELAVCKHFNVMPDLSFEPRGGGHDCIIKNKLVDVKSTKVGKTTVYLPQRKSKNPIDIYIWCYVNFRQVEILGYFRPQEIFTPENLKQSPRVDELHYEIDLLKINKF